MNGVSDELYASLVRLAQGRSDPAERRQLEALLAENAEARDALAAIREASAVMREFVDAGEPSGEELARRQASIAALVARPRRRRLLPLAAAGVAIALIFVVSWATNRPVVIGQAALTGPLGVHELVWFDVRDGADLFYPGKTLQLRLREGTELTLTNGCRGTAHHGRFVLLDGQVQGTVSHAAFVVALSDCELRLPPSTSFSVSYKPIGPGPACTIYVSKEAVLSCADGERPVTAGEIVTVDPGDSANTGSP